MQWCSVAHESHVAPWHATCSCSHSEQHFPMWPPPYVSGKWPRPLPNGDCGWQLVPTLKLVLLEEHENCSPPWSTGLTVSVFIAILLHRYRYRYRSLKFYFLALTVLDLGFVCQWEIGRAAVVSANKKGIGNRILDTGSVQTQWAMVDVSLCAILSPVFVSLLVSLMMLWCPCQKTVLKTPTTPHPTKLCLLVWMDYTNQN